MKDNEEEKVGVLENKIKELKLFFKDAKEVLSVQESRFFMINYDLNSIHYDDFTDSFYIKDNEGQNHKELFNNCSGKVAKIIN